MVNYSKIPDELKEGREQVECNFIMALFKDPTLIDSYKNVVIDEDILTKDGKFYYGLLQALDKAGFQQFDDMSVITFLEDKPTVRKEFEKRGGIETLHEILSIVNVNNIDTYYDVLCRNNLLIRLYLRGFNVLKNLDKFKTMSATDVSDYFEYVLADASVGKIEKITVSDLSDGYNEFLDEWDKGTAVGYKIGSQMLNYTLAGVHKNNLLIHAAPIGAGKTTTAILFYVLPNIMAGNNVVLMSNEQSENEIRQIILSAVCFNHFNTKDSRLNRQKVVVGRYTDDQRKLLNQAAEWLKSQPGKIHFVPLQDYNTQNLRRIITKYAKLGTGLFILDTLKPLMESSDRAWAEFSEAAKSLFLLAKQLQVAIICTAQVSGSSFGRSYLDLSSLAKSRSIAETAQAVILMRHIRIEEYDKVKPWTWDKERKIKEEKELDPDKDYIMLFPAKNRSGRTDRQIVCEFNQDFLTTNDIGWWQQPYDNFRGG